MPPAGGRPVLVHGASQKRAPDPKIGGFLGCTISGSVQKTVRCTVFSDRSPRAERKLRSSAARSRPVGDGAPRANFSAVFNAKKDPQTKPFAGLSSWCTISGSVQKTVQCTVFSDRSPRGECKPHRGAARARPVGDGAPRANLSAAHNAKKDPQTEPFAGLSSWCTIGDSNPGPTD